MSNILVKLRWDQPQLGCQTQIQAEWLKVKFVYRSRSLRLRLLTAENLCLPRRRTESWSQVACIESLVVWFSRYASRQTDIQTYILALWSQYFAPHLLYPGTYVRFKKWDESSRARGTRGWGVGRGVPFPPEAGAMPPFQIIWGTEEARPPVDSPLALPRAK